MDDREKWKTILNGPYFGISTFGLQEEPVKSDDYFDFVMLLDGMLAEYNFNSLSLGEWTSDLKVSRSKSTHRMKRKLWDKILVSLPHKKWSNIYFTSVPSSKFRGVEFSRMAIWTALQVRPISNSFFECPWNKKEAVFNVDSKNVIFDFFSTTLKVTDVKYGFVQLFAELKMKVLTPPYKQKFSSDAWGATPLIDRVGKSRYNGFLSGKQTTPWQGEPFNLYWGNLFGRDISESIQLEKFLIEELGFELLSDKDTVCSKPFILHISTNQICFCLSPNIEDSLNPDNDYIDRYNTILDYLIKHDVIYPGL